MNHHDLKDLKDFRMYIVIESHTYIGLPFLQAMKLDMGLYQLSQSITAYYCAYSPVNNVIVDKSVGAFGDIKPISEERSGWHPIASGTPDYVMQAKALNTAMEDIM